MLSIALKEWHLLTQALLEGRQAFLLRKGGILEANNEFELEQPRFLLYPTYVHQDPASVKPAWRDRIVKLPAEPDQLTIEAWAETVKIFVVPSRPAMGALDDLHIWDKPLIDMRFAYRPSNPLYLVVVRTWRLPQAIVVPNTLEYAGCKSWVPLQQSLDTRGSVSAVSADKLAAIVERVNRTFSA